MIMLLHYLPKHYDDTTSLFTRVIIRTDQIINHIQTVYVTQYTSLPTCKVSQTFCRAVNLHSIPNCERIVIKLSLPASFLIWWLESTFWTLFVILALFWHFLSKKCQNMEKKWSYQIENAIFGLTTFKTPCVPISIKSQKHCTDIVSVM